ncbi:MAG: sigma-70 family RNA polymerase sigma factor, partial [bacterium]|nr:sigma-70 family RNA polymerase sigma factor [bacterium]
MAETTIGFHLDSLSSETLPVPEETDEKALIEGLQLGAEEAYEMLIARYQHPVYNLVYRLVENPGDTNDVVQEVFVKVFRHIPSFRAKSSLKTWVYRIAVNEAYNYRRWWTRHNRREVAFENEQAPTGRRLTDWLPDPGRSPYEITLGAETRSLIQQELSRLKPIFKQAVVLGDVEDLCYGEIAEVLNVSIGAVKSRILRGREAV